MKKILPIILCVFVHVFSSYSQTKNNDSIIRQIAVLKAEKTFSLTLDPGGNTSKLLAVSENFSDNEARKSGILAMNFAAGVFYAGDSLQSSPERILFTFWVLTKKPRFAASHGLRVFAGDEIMDVGDGRYSARARDDMEYLNFELPRETIAKIARQSNVRLALGEHEFTFTGEQLKTLANLLILSEVQSGK
ncbi:MAG TPA: hypothetical protein VK468_10330 [Pyrinomonadaceae bacterium]|nr:hypothetical protein [Pyrinomonadaceae bacterium]